MLFLVRLVQAAVAALRVEAAFRAAGGLRAAAGLRGAGDEHFERRPRANCERHSFCRGKDVGPNRLRAGADILPHHGIARLYRRCRRTRNALVADDLHGDDSSPDSVAAGRRIFSAFDAFLPTARADCPYAA